MYRNAGWRAMNQAWFGPCAGVDSSRATRKPSGPSPTTRARAAIDTSCASSSAVSAFTSAACSLLSASTAGRSTAWRLRTSMLGLPEPVFQAALDHDCEGPPLSLSSRRIGDGRAAFLGLLHGLLDVFDREVGPHDRLLMRGQGLPDAHQSSVRSCRDSGLPEI